MSRLAAEDAGITEPSSSPLPSPSSWSGVSELGLASAPVPGFATRIVAAADAQLAAGRLEPVTEGQGDTISSQRTCAVRAA